VAGRARLPDQDTQGERGTAMETDEVVDSCDDGTAFAVMEAIMKHEHREFSRAPLSASVKFFEWNRARSADAIEISASGIFLKTPVQLAEGSMLTLRLALPGLKRAFTVLGKVVRTVRGGLFAPAGMGIRFLDLRPTDREEIMAYVAQRALEAA
jgi:uncharacterized protein (TIGR02266 family)